MSDLNRRLKRWPAWGLMALLAASFLVVGATRDAGPQTPEDRVDEITKRLACPICDGESVFESQNNVSRNIRTEVGQLVRENDLSDDEILAVFEARDSEILLVPKSSGLDALAWMLPVFALIAGLIGLAFAFRRWRDEAASLRDPTQADRDLVASALDAEDDT
ncbi:MAG: cytochrome c-type biogenesis protein CcmH [Actinomycetota bacterium]